MKIEVVVVVMVAVVMWLVCRDGGCGGWIWWRSWWCMRRWLWWLTCGVGGAAIGGGRCDDGDLGCEVWRSEMIVVVGMKMMVTMGCWPELGRDLVGKQEGALEILEEREKCVYVWLGFGNKMKETLMGEVFIVGNLKIKRQL
ncbi:hypothetical protein Tco_1397132 [Tanacetum coccineum]